MVRIAGIDQPRVPLGGVEVDAVNSALIGCQS
jgi:hypothetical protein